MSGSDSLERTVSGNLGIGRRNRFFPRKQMGVDEFQLEQSYFIERRRLINRTVIGWGVVGGFELTPAAGDSPCGHMSAGFALDRHGRELALVDALALGSKNLFLRDESGPVPLPLALSNCESGRYLLAAHYAERWVVDVDVGGTCGCRPPDKSFACETVVFSIRPLPEKRNEGEEEEPGCPCEEKPCGEGKLARSCDCGAASACGCEGSRHACLCQWVKQSPAIQPKDMLCPWEGYDVALDDAISLACITIEKNDNKCCPIVLRSIEDACGPRRIVKGNDLLHDLLRGCDLTRIREVSWSRWFELERVSWDEFADRFLDGEGGRTRFKITFSRPVKVATLDRHAIVMKAIRRKNSTGWYEERRVPIERLEPRPDEHAHGPASEAMTTECTVVVGQDWLQDEVSRKSDSWLEGRTFTFEIEIHGDRILDCHGLRVDAEAGSRARPTPSGNGSPGGIFRSCFRVQGKPVRGDRDRDDNVYQQARTAP